MSRSDQVHRTNQHIQQLTQVGSKTDWVCEISNINVSMQANLEKHTSLCSVYKNLLGNICGVRVWAGDTESSSNLISQHCKLAG